MTQTTQATEYIVAADAAPIVADVVADIGNARTVILVRREGDDVPSAITMPSVRSLHGAFSWELFAARGLPPQSWARLGRDEHVIEAGGVERFVGQLAVEHVAAASSGRGSDARYYDGTTLDFILAGGGDSRLAIEVDGFEHHERTQEQAERDRARDRALLAEGVETIRFMAKAVFADPGKCAAEAFTIGMKRCSPFVVERTRWKR